jgi:hypothetical protein
MKHNNSGPVPLDFGGQIFRKRDAYRGAVREVSVNAFPSHDGRQDLISRYGGQCIGHLWIVTGATSNDEKFGISATWWVDTTDQLSDISIRDSDGNEISGLNCLDTFIGKTIMVHSLRSTEEYLSMTLTFDDGSDLIIRSTSTLGTSRGYSTYHSDPSFASDVLLTREDKPMPYNRDIALFDIIDEV